MFIKRLKDEEIKKEIRGKAVTRKEKSSGTYYLSITRYEHVLEDCLKEV